MEAQLELERERLSSFNVYYHNLLTDCKNALLQLENYVKFRNTTESLDELDNIASYNPVFLHDHSSAKSLKISCCVCGNDLFNGILDFLNHSVQCGIRFTSWQQLATSSCATNMHFSPHEKLAGNVYDNPTLPYSFVSVKHPFPKIVTIEVSNQVKKSGKHFEWLLSVATIPPTTANLIQRVTVRLDPSYLQHTVVLSSAPWSVGWCVAFREFTVSLMVEFYNGTPLFIDHRLSLKKKKVTKSCVYLWI
ncbi:hypothetical protein P9112_007515 [Eukaryota sp. TZLM1-RC]